jgi:hypothetical protein
MKKRVVSEQPGKPSGEAPPAPAGSAGVMEERVRRLEDAVAGLQDTRQLEERVAAKVSARLESVRTPPREAAGLVLETGRRLLPMARELLRVDDPLPAGAAASARPLGPTAPPADHSPRRSWLLWEACAELRLITQMILDPRYRMTWRARLVVLGVLPGVLLSWWLWSPLPFISLVPDTVRMLLDKALDVALIFHSYKVLARELIRYRDLVPEQDVTYGS